MAEATIDSNRINDWESFHEHSQEVFGFPNLYGKNMDAWIDCLSYLDEDDGMSRFHLKPGETLTINILNARSLEARLAEIYKAIIECSTLVNERYVEFGKKPLLNLVLT